MAFNENSRVKIPTILHLCSLGYKYLPLQKVKWNTSTNIFPEIFALSGVSILTFRDCLAPHVVFFFNTTHKSNALFLLQNCPQFVLKCI